MAGNLNTCVSCKDHKPTEPRTLPCQHVICTDCLHSLVEYSRTNHVSLACAECRKGFIKLPESEPGCHPIGPRLEFQASNYLPASQVVGCAWISDVKAKVMGMTLVGDELFVVYSRSPLVRAYTVGTTSMRVINTSMIWPRGIAANVKTKLVYAIDWATMRSGLIYKISGDKKSPNGAPEVFAKLTVQPFGITVITDDRVMVTCSTPVRMLLPVQLRNNKIFIFDASGQLQTSISLPNLLEIPRHSVQMGSVDEFLVCHGWTGSGKVVRVNSGGELLDGCYGSDQTGEQSLNKPLFMCPDGNESYFVVDYYGNRVQLLNSHLQLVQHVITKSDNFNYPRQVCFDRNSGILLVGLHNGDILSANIVVKI